MRCGLCAHSIDHCGGPFGYRSIFPLFRWPMRTPWKCESSRISSASLCNLHVYLHAYLNVYLQCRFCMFFCMPRLRAHLQARYLPPSLHSFPFAASNPHSFTSQRHGATRPRSLWCTSLSLEILCSEKLAQNEPVIASLSICPNVLLAISAIYFNLQCFVVFYGYDSSDDQNYDEHNHSFRLTTIITPTMPPEWSARPVMTGCSKSLRVTESHRESPRVTQSDDGDRNFLIETISLFAERRQWRELSNFETRSA